MRFASFLKSVRLWLRLTFSALLFPLLYVWKQYFQASTERRLRPLLPLLGVQFMAQFDDDLVTRQLESIGIICKTVTVDGASLTTGAVGTGTVAVAGLTPAHRCLVMGSAAPSVAVAVFGARCAAAGTLTVDFVNPSAGTLNIASQTFTLLAIPGDLN